MWFSRSKKSLEVKTRCVQLLSSHDYRGNQIITSHYTATNFVPMNVFEQFCQPANIYFLFLSVLQTLPRITTTHHMPFMLLPLTCIVCVNMMKDAVLDWRRHKSDKEENERPSLCIRNAQSEAGSSKWCDVQVGNIIIVKNNEYVPADIVILTSAHEEGHVYIDTANLDGETNLKTRQAPDDVFSLVGHHETWEDAIKSAQKLVGDVECEPPNERLESFTGTITLSKEGKEPQMTPTDAPNLLLRGCKVKNVSWAMGVVVYTGTDTKIMMNSKDKEGRKLSHLEKDVMKFTKLIFLIQVVLCTLAASISAAFDTSRTNYHNRSYLRLTDHTRDPENGFLIFVIRFFTTVILFANFIPISLLVKLNVVKLIQAFLMYQDPDMVFREIGCMPRTADLNEELGQVEYIFSDKTGTLTCNVMDFRKFCVNGVTYGQGMTEIKRNVLIRQGKKVQEPATPANAKVTPHVDLHDTTLDDLLKSQRGPQFAAVRAFLMHLSINHEVVPELSEDGTVLYSASSPDESALCYGARHFGWSFRTRDSQGITVERPDGSMMHVKIHVILKFNSLRKRSSVIATFEDNFGNGEWHSRLMLLTKGADSVILARLSSEQQASQEMGKTMGILKDFAEEGLRTLCLAGRDLSREEFSSWFQRYKAAACAVSDDRQDQLDNLADEIEVDLEMHGITGIEDRLQDDVANTINKMKAAGIKVWMATGDKTETAINIGIATGLLDPEQKVPGERPVFTTTDFEVNGVFQPQGLHGMRHCLKTVAQQAVRRTSMFEGLVIDGNCLMEALKPENEKDFVAIARMCRTVICCRVSPKQKGAVVRLIKREEKAITLAIGDGANDCNMIQSADVGIGIRGVEGLQAFNVCDYGISQFRFLQHLILVHGRWCYRRSALLVNYMFYKNFVLVLPQYFLGVVSAFSGQKLYNDVLYQFFNVVHSMLPIAIFGVLDQDVSKKVSLTHPELYTLGPARSYMNVRYSAGWMLSGLWQSLVVFFVPYYTMSNGNFTHSDGKANDLWIVGTVVYLLVTIIVNLEVLLETAYFTSLSVFGIFFSFFFWALMHGYVSGYLTGTIVTADLWGSTERILSSPMIFLVIVTSVIWALMWDVQLKCIKGVWFPSVLHKVQAQVLRDRPNKNST